MRYDKTLSELHQLTANENTLIAEVGRMALKTIHLLEEENRLYKKACSLKRLEEWHEDDGACLWWKMPIEEAPYCGSPLDFEWPGYHTHFTEIILPKSQRFKI